MSGHDIVALQQHHVTGIGDLDVRGTRQLLGDLTALLDRRQLVSDGPDDQHRQIAQHHQGLAIVMFVEQGQELRDDLDRGRGVHRGRELDQRRRPAFHERVATSEHVAEVAAGAPAAFDQFRAPGKGSHHTWSRLVGDPAQRPRQAE
jgi:hypothetical protein